MKVTALLAWYDANPHWLSATIASLGHIGVSRVVASDGAYALFPNATARSGGEQVDALQTICDALNIELVLYRPASKWIGGEQDKRDHLFKLATFDATIGEDWLFVIDDDEVVREVATPRLVHEQLANTDALVMTAGCMQPSPSWLLPEEAAIEGKYHETLEMVESFRQRYAIPHMNGPWLQSRFFRVVEDMRCEVTHYTYSGVWEGKRYALRADALGTRLGYELAPTEHIEGVFIEHRDLLRPKFRRDMKREYYHARDAAGIETPEYHGREVVATDVPARAV